MNFRTFFLNYLAISKRVIWVICSFNFISFRKLELTPEIFEANKLFLLTLYTYLIFSIASLKYLLFFSFQGCYITLFLVSCCFIYWLLALFIISMKRFSLWNKACEKIYIFLRNIFHFSIKLDSFSLYEIRSPNPVHVPRSLKPR